MPFLRLQELVVVVIISIIWVAQSFHGYGYVPSLFCARSKLCIGMKLLHRGGQELNQQGPSYPIPYFWTFQLCEAINPLYYLNLVELLFS